MKLFLLALAAWMLLTPVGHAQTPTPAPAAAASAPAAPLSATARRLFDGVRHELVQVRTLLAQQDSQASVGSGFVVSQDGLIVSNYHVVSQAALEPQGFRLRFIGADGRKGGLQILAIDVRRDLALLRAVDEVKGEPLRFERALAFRPAAEPLSKGDRIYSLGHPHDVAFAIVEGNYNGLVERSFDPLIYYAGSINPGMSGGPVLDDQGRVVGVNVSGMMFSQQMSFLVPGGFAEALVQRAAKAKPLQGPVWPQVREQLLAYSAELTRSFMALPWTDWGHAHYRMPIPQEKFVRCWGRATEADDSKGLQFQRSHCRMDHAVFLSGSLQTGYLEVQHEVYDGSRIGALRFAKAYSDSFQNERLARQRDRHRTAAHCTESFIDAQGLPARAVVCLRAYRKMADVHDVTVMLTAVDQTEQGLLGRFDARGVGFDDALKLAKHFIQGYRLQKGGAK
jgi:serine protease Do